MRAIILAAGMGTRLRPLTNDTPKSLIKIAGEPMVDRQIRFLNEVGIDEIIVVTGYLHHKFEYLRDKYGVTLVHNDKYDLYNNIYSMYLVRDYLQDAYVNDADIYLAHNFFKSNIDHSTIFSGMKYNFKQEWIIKHDEHDRINEIVIADGSDYINSGITFWTKEDGILLKGQIEATVLGGNFEEMYWDNIVQENINRINAKITKINTDDWFEIDSIEDYENVNKYLLINK